MIRKQLVWKWFSAILLFTAAQNEPKTLEVILNKKRKKRHVHCPNLNRHKFSFGLPSFCSHPGTIRALNKTKEPFALSLFCKLFKVQSISIVFVELIQSGEFDNENGQ